MTQPGVYIPYPLRVRLNQINPRLDSYWAQNLQQIFKVAKPELRQALVQQFLEPMGIRWSTVENTFVLTYQALPFAEFADKIPHPGMRMRAQKIAEYLNVLAGYSDALQVADFLENILIQIDQIDVGEDLEMQKIKRDIHAEFIYAAAALIRTKESLTIPSNHRGLNTEIISIFINEVFLKQRLLDFWFRTLRRRQLAAMKPELLNCFLLEEQKNRQLEVVRTSKYLFALAPAHERGVNPFSIRRFLSEEQLFDRGRVYLNGAVIDLARVEQLDYYRVFKAQIDRIVSLESSVSQAVIDLVLDLDAAQEKHLLPLLFKPLKAAHADVKQAVSLRLQEYEHHLVQHILLPLHHGLTKLAVHEDEFDYLYVNIRQLLGDIISSFKDFLSQPALLFNAEGNLFFGRLVAYASLLGKRRNAVFAPMSAEEWQHNHTQLEGPLARLRTVVQQGAQAHGRLLQECAKKQQQLEKAPSMLDKVFKRREREEQAFDALRKQAEKTHWQAYIDVIQVPKQFRDAVVHLEFESMLDINVQEHNYAFASGDNGVTRLPIQITVPKDRTGLDLNALNRALHLAEKRSAALDAPFSC